jgi:hypothetical protein
MNVGFFNESVALTGVGGVVVVVVSLNSWVLPWVGSSSAPR